VLQVVPQGQQFLMLNRYHRQVRHHHQLKGSQRHRLMQNHHQRHQLLHLNLYLLQVHHQLVHRQQQHHHQMILHLLHRSQNQNHHQQQHRHLLHLLIHHLPLPHLRSL
jgi:hypothetical protein